jgi:hypothetical protein
MSKEERYQLEGKDMRERKELNYYTAQAVANRLNSFDPAAARSQRADGAGGLKARTALAGM